MLAYLLTGCASAGGRTVATPSVDKADAAMEERVQLTDLVGTWSGLNRLWLMPGDPVRESETRASVTSAAHGAVVSLTYSWDYEGQPQEGVLMLRNHPAAAKVEVVWLDSWHTGNEFMLFAGDADHEGLVAVRGSYAAPPGPDWGWRIVLDADDADALQILMCNITPEGEEALAVDARYIRVAEKS